MKRRGFLGLLLALPFAPALAETAAKTIKTSYTGMDLAVKGSDQTSIWITEYDCTFGPPPTLLDIAKERMARRDKDILPMIETLSQRNPLLQDMVWQERNLQLGHKIDWGNKWGKS